MARVMARSPDRAIAGEIVSRSGDHDTTLAKSCRGRETTTQRRGRETTTQRQLRKYNEGL
jgi:hypothetical protein